MAIKKILLYPISAIFYLAFSLTLLLFHVVQWLSYNLGGYKAHKVSVDIMNLSLKNCLYLAFNKASYTNQHNIPTNTPLIIISNHQSMFDIIAISWYMRKHHPKFISKIELGKGIPSVSYNLNHGGSVLIDRSNARQSLPALAKFGKYIAETKRAAVIFPEGTRSKNGKPKEFNTTGLKILLKNIPDGLVVPVTVNNSWKLLKYGMFPFNSGINLNLKVHSPLKINEYSADEIIALAEERIKQDIKL